MIPAILFLLLLAGSIVYCGLSLVAAARYLSSTKPALAQHPEPISILKPLSGLDLGLEENLRTFFEQEYASFEILFAVRRDDDPSVSIVSKLQAEYPRVASKLIITGEPPYPNAKVFSLHTMMQQAAHDLCVMSDSDIRVTPSLLSTVAGEFSDPSLGVSTCPYRAVAGPSLWSKIEATGMNTDFISGILVARLLEGMKFAVGPTIAARRKAIQAIGGFARVSEYLAEDFVLGKFAYEKGFGVALSSYVVEHHIGAQTLAPNAAHRLRWSRSTHRSRPAGYVGQLFMMPVPLAIFTVLLHHAWWPILPLTYAVRFAVAFMMSTIVLGARLNPILLAVEDIAAFAFWCAGFFGNTIVWRSRRYKLLRDGRFELLSEE